MLERITEDEELIKALRNCSNEAIEMCPPCKYFAWDKPKDDCKFEMMRDAADAIEELISIVPKWISVKEKLPPSNELVIVSIYDTHGDTAFRYSSTGWLTSDTKVWVVDDEENSGVTHWMKLPEMQKGK